MSTLETVEEQPSAEDAHQHFWRGYVQERGNRRRWNPRFLNGMCMMEERQGREDEHRHSGEGDVPDGRSGQRWNPRRLPDGRAQHTRKRSGFLEQIGVKIEMTPPAPGRMFDRI